MNPPGDADLQAWFYAGREEFARGEHADPVARAQRAADAVIARSPLAAERACAIGCTACCHFPVGATVAEVRAILDHLEHDPDPLVHRAVRARLAATAPRVAAETWDEQAAARRACVLLADDGRCTVHAVRPLACRGWNALDRTACERDLAGAPGVSVQPDGPAYAAGLGVAAQLREVVDPRVYELTGLLQRVAQGAALDDCKRAPG